MSRSRTVNTRPQKTKVYVFCEGDVTEVKYLKELERSQNKVKLDVVLTGAVPRTLYDGAISKLNEVRRSGNSDRVWLIFDRDEHPRVDEVLHACLNVDIVVGYSNPCFEVWLHWHIDDYGGTHERGDLKNLVSEICEDYCRKGKCLKRAENLMGSIDDACDRAWNSEKKLENSGAKFGRPTSTMYAIIDDFCEISNTDNPSWRIPK